MHVCVTCLSHTGLHEHVSIAVATFFKVKCEDIKKLNSLSRHTIEPLNITKMSYAFYTITEYRFIYSSNREKICYFTKHVKTGCIVLK
jgi:hypothetical protein